jgi:HK97 gp10 family phage protein
MSDFDFKTTGFTVSGFAELSKALEGLTKQQVAKGLSPLLTKALKPMSLVAISLAPDDPRTGPPYDLKSSITVSTRQRSGRARRNRALGEYSARAYMGPTGYGYPQAIMDEFGTIHMSARAFMRPAWDSGKEGALDIIKDGYAARVFKTAAKYKPA